MSEYYISGTNFYLDFKNYVQKSFDPIGIGRRGTS